MSKGFRRKSSLYDLFFAVYTLLFQLNSEASVKGLLYNRVLVRVHTLLSYLKRVIEWTRLMKDLLTTIMCFQIWKRGFVKDPERLNSEVAYENPGKGD